MDGFGKWCSHNTHCLHCRRSTSSILLCRPYQIQFTLPSLTRYSSWELGKGEEEEEEKGVKERGGGGGKGGEEGEGRRRKAEND